MKAKSLKNHQNEIAKLFLLIDKLFSTTTLTSSCKKCYYKRTNRQIDAANVFDVGAPFTH